jgi:uncharacterized membrane protein YgdD (TMEM256/DUF423 family)
VRDRWVVVSGVLGLLAVALGAFGAHALADRIPPERMEVFRTGALYHLLHAVALLAVACLPYDRRALRVARWAFLVGIVLFSGSLYLLAVTGVRWLGAITPVGGTAFLVGWLALALAPRASRGV